MKTMRKLFAMVLAMTMVLAMATTAGAASITITGAQPEGTYSLYKMATTYEDNDKYLLSEQNWDGFWVQESMADYFTVTTKEIDGAERKIVIATDAAEANATVIAAAAKTWAEDSTNGITATTDVPNANETSAEFTGLDSGYYLVVSPMGENLILKNVTGDETYAEKNSKLPDLTEKTVNDNTVKIGDVVTFTLKITTGHNENNTLDYKIHDVMTEGLELVDDSVQVTYNGSAFTGFTVTEDACTEDPAIAGCDFEISFDDTLSTAVGKEMVITYNALVTADIKETSTNTAHITDSTGTDDDDDEDVQTGKFILNKTDSVTGEELDGAEFELYDANNNKVNLVEITEGAEYRVATNEEAAADGFTSAVIKAGTGVVVRGLDEGTYTLKETKAPDGYVLDTNGKTVTISITDDTDDENKVDITYTNAYGDELPETGGMGTTLFYIVGGLMVAGAAILLVTKKRMGAAE